MAIYHFARTADDIADEGDATTSSRLADLAAFRADLVASLAGTPVGARWPQVFRPLAERVRTHALPGAPLHALLDAFEQDTRNPVYADRAELLGYCARSANPVGRLLLHLYGVGDAVSLRHSDAICTSLQLINFWQDLSVDLPRGRVYLPLADLQAFGLDPTSVQKCVDTEASRRLVRELCNWAEGLMREGAPLALRLPGRAGWELRLVVQGGLRIIEKIRAMNHATLSQRPTIRAAEAPRLLWRAWRMGAATR